MKAFPANPSPPETTKAPEEVEVVAVVLETNKLEKFEGVVEGTKTVPPINAFPANPIPPETINAPEEVEVVAVVFVTANPESETIPVAGFTTKEVIVERPKPLPLEALTVVIKNDCARVVGITATEDAAAGGTACQVGAAFAPFEVSTYPVLEEAAYLDQVEVVFATIMSPIAVGPCRPVPPYKAVIVDPDQVPEVTIPLAKRTFEIFDVLVDGTFIVPPIKAFPANPNPPLTAKAPVDVDVEAVLWVIAT